MDHVSKTNKNPWRLWGFLWLFLRSRVPNWLRKGASKLLFWSPSAAGAPDRPLSVKGKEMMPCHSFLHQHLKRRCSHDIFHRGQGNVFLNDRGCSFYDSSTAACIWNKLLFRFRVKNLHNCWIWFREISCRHSRLAAGWTVINWWFLDFSSSVVTNRPTVYPLV